MMRNYPAYGRPLASHVMRGMRPRTVLVLLSARWDYYDHQVKVCVKPDEWKLGRFEFAYLRGLHVVAVQGEEASYLQLAELLVDLMRAGPRLLWVWSATGEKIYDGDDAHEVALYARQCAAEDKALDRLTPAAIRGAELVMVAAQTRARELWHREYQRVLEKRGDEAAVQWMLGEFQVKDRVRELLASPWKAEDAAAA